MKKILSIILVIITLASLAVPISAAETINGVDITKSSVTEDLGLIYDLNDFKADSSNKDISLITVQEYGYGTLDHTLYMYFYNPSGKTLSNSDFNKVELASSWNSSGEPNGYKKQPIEIVSVSSDRLLIKCKLGKTSGSFYRKLNNARHYTISGIELNTVGSDFEQLKDYTVGYTFSFSGSGNTLACNRTDQLTIKLDVHQTSYLTGDSAKKKDDLDNGWYSNQINSVYFSIPKAIEQEYGDLYSINYEYYKYRTSPILVVDDESTYSKLSYLSGKNLLDGDFGYSIYDRIFDDTSQSKFVGGFWFGDKVSSSMYVYDKYPQIGTYQDYHTLVLKVDDVTDRENILISSDKLQDAFEKYLPLGEDNNYINHSGVTIGSNKYFGDLFDLDYYTENCYSADVKVGEEFDMPSFADLLEEQGVKNGWQRFWKFGLDISLNIENYDETIQNAKYIEQVKYTDIPSTPEVASSKYLVSVNDITAFRDYCSDAARNDENVYLLRYAKSDDYYCLNMTSSLDGNIMLVQENVYLDFDIISLSFEKDGKITVIPVVSDLTDGFTGIENVTPLPPDEAISEYFQNLKNWWQDSAPKLVGLLILIVSIILLGWLAISVPSWIFGKKDKSTSLFSDKKDKDKDNNTTVNITIQEDELRRRSNYSQGQYRSPYRGSYRYKGKRYYNNRYRYKRRK